MLPPEILIQIFQELSGSRASGISNNLALEEDTYDDDGRNLDALTQVSLASKAFYSIATPLLYQSIDLDLDSYQYPPFKSTLASRAELGRHTIRLRLTKELENENLDYIQSALAVANLVGKMPNLEQLVLSGMNMHYEFDEHAAATWTQAFRSLYDCPKFSSLWVLRGLTPFELLRIPTLQDLRIDHGGPALTFYSPLPALTTLCIPSTYLTSDQVDPCSLERLLPRLHHLGCDNPGVDSSVVSILGIVMILATSLKVLRCGIRMSQEEFDLQHVWEVREELQSVQGIPACRMEELRICIAFDSRRVPSAELLEGVRQFLFEIRSSGRVTVEVKGLPEGEFCNHLEQVWQGDGATVNITRLGGLS